MRIHHLAILAFAILASYGCQKPCNPKCGSNERCDDGKCVDCGSVGETCCQPYGHFECFDGSTCDNTHYPICIGDCGSIGLPCCIEAQCPGSGTCDEGMCVGDAVDCAGDTFHTFSVIDQYGCVQDTYSFTSGPGNLQECADAGLASINPDGLYHMGPIDEPATCQDVCKDTTDPFGTYNLCTNSPEDLATCEAYFCSECSWTAGQCPG